MSEINNAPSIGVEQTSNELIPLTQNKQGQIAVSARELHKFLEVGKDFSTWIKDRIYKYDFVENQDFEVFPNFGENSNGGRPSIEYALTLDMAKELSMVENNEKGKQARKYFIECEKRLNSSHNAILMNIVLADTPEQRAVALNEYLLSHVRPLEQENKVMKPKSEYFDALVDRNLLTNFRNTAKELGIQEKIFINFLLEKGFVYRDSKNKLRPYAEYTTDKNKLFELKEFQRNNIADVQTLITVKGRETFRLLISNIK